MSMMETVRNEDISQSASINSNARTFKIKRLGARPLSFHGNELGMAMSFTPPSHIGTR